MKFLDIPNNTSVEALKYWLDTHMPDNGNRWDIHWYYNHGYKLKFYNDEDATWFKLSWKE